MSSHPILVVAIYNPILRRPPFFISSITGELGPQAERKGKDGKGKGKDGKDRDGGYGKGKGREEMHKGKGKPEEDANPGKGAYPIGPPVMRAPSNPSPPAMKPPPTKAPEVTVTDVVKAPQPTHRPGYKPPPASVPSPQRITPIPSSSPAGVKTPFKGQPKGHPDYKEVSITYLPFTPKKPPPQMPEDGAVVPQRTVHKPPPGPGYAGLSREQYEAAQEKYRRDIANRNANRDRDANPDRDYGTGSASSGTQPGDRGPSSSAAAAAVPSESEDANLFRRGRATNKMPPAYGHPRPPPPYSPPTLPPGVEITNMLTTPELGLIVDIDLNLEALWRGHLTDHPQLTECYQLYLYNDRQFVSYPSLRVFSELILLAYLRSIRVAQEALCLGNLRYPPNTSHITHHEFSECCLLVTRQRERIEHAFRHQWKIASHLDFNSLTGAQQVLHRALTTYLHMCWNLTVTNYDGNNPPLYPLLPKRRPNPER
eukprot:6295336-Amphidinium_carterae.1